MTGLSPLDTARALAPGDYQIDPARTTIRFETRHMFGLAPVTGEFNLTAGHVRITSPLERSSAELTIATGSFRTGGKRRDKDVTGKRFLHAAQRPQITVRIDRAEVRDQAILGHGTLDAGPRPAPVTVEVTGIETDGSTIRARARAHVDRYAHGITAA